MNNKIIAILKKIYHHENGFYNSDLDRHEHKIPESVSNEDLELLKKNGLKPNNFHQYNHDEALQQLLEFKNNSKITLPFAASLFIKGITAEFPRGRQTLMSFIYIKHLYEHAFEGMDNCEICGLPKNETIDKTYQLYTYYLGHSWNELPLHFLIELEEILNYKQPVITPSDKEKLNVLLDFIANSDSSITPSKLEQAMAKNKLIPQSDKYRRYGILQTLAECGILPNPYIKPRYDTFITQKVILKANENIQTSHRSDIVLPLAGWNGEHGVNVKCKDDIFKDL